MKIGFPEIFVAVLSAGVMTMVLGLIPFSPLPATLRITSLIGILFQMLWLITLVTYQIDKFPIPRFRKGAEIVWMVGLGGGFLGACIGAPAGVALSEAIELSDMLGAAVIVGFYGAAIGFATSWILAMVYVGFFWLVSGSLISRLPLSVAGLLTGLLVGGSLPSILVLSLPYLSFPSGKEAIVNLILLPAVICAAYGALASRVGHR